MKIILTGKNSYISNNTCTYINSLGFDAECVSIRNGVDSIDFNGVDAVIHCAAIVHKKEKDYINEYDKVNYDLTVELVNKALKSGVKHFVFLSTMAVYGKTVGEINSKTPLEPTTLYGKSKLKAEEYLILNIKGKMKVSIIRPPMVYGKNCVGNYTKLSKIAKLTPVIPDTKNKKSLVYIENLAYLIGNIVKEGKEGIFMPMDNEYVSTAKIMKLISNKPISVFLGTILKLLPFNIVKKSFGTLFYSEEIATKIDYIPVDKAVRLSEK